MPKLAWLPSISSVPVAERLPLTVWFCAKAEEPKPNDSIKANDKQARARARRSDFIGRRSGKTKKRAKEAKTQMVTPHPQIIINAILYKLDELF